jgi:hypothetical protein|tara:strand:+ start:1240 stop:1533 length:294 start_codon:yes stop_codon:yes gene_type:complete
MRLAEARKVLEESDKHSRGVIEKAKEVIQASLKGKIEDTKMEKMQKSKMAYGGTVMGKKHFYVAGGSVTLNEGLKALRKSSPIAFAKITKGKTVKGE